MKAEQIKKGDVLVQDGQIVYTVEARWVNHPHIVALVRFADGGTGQRMWEVGKQTPLVHGPDWGKGNG